MEVLEWEPSCGGLANQLERRDEAACNTPGCVPLTSCPQLFAVLYNTYTGTALSARSMDDLDFLEQASTADSSAVATLMVLLPDGSVIQIPDINTFIVLDKCPLLYHAFEFREYGDAQQASVEVGRPNSMVSPRVY